MPDLEDIVQRITIEGGEEVAAAFGKVGRIGVDAFKALAQAGGEASEVLAGSALAITALGSILFEFAKGAAEAVEQLTSLSQQAGESIESISGLQSAIASLGGSTEGLGPAFSRMGRTISHEWEAVTKDIIKGSEDVEKAEAALFHAREAKAAAYGQQYYTEGDKRWQKEKEAITAQKEAERELDQARRNSYSAYSKAIHDVIVGNKDAAAANKDANITAENVVKGLVADTEGAEEALKNFNGSLSSLVGEGPKLKQVFYNLADFFKNSGNAALNQAVSMRIFGRGVNDGLVVPLTHGSKALQEHEEEQKKFGLVITKDMQRPAEEFHENYNKLIETISQSKTQFGLTFAPAFAKGLEDVNHWLMENHQSLTAFGEGVVAIGGKIKDAFGEIIHFGDQVANVLNKINSGLSSIGAGLGKALGTDKLGPVEKLFDTEKPTGGLGTKIGDFLGTTKFAPWLKKQLGIEDGRTPVSRGDPRLRGTTPLSETKPTRYEDLPPELQRRVPQPAPVTYTDQPSKDARPVTMEPVKQGADEIKDGATQIKEGGSDIKEGASDIKGAAGELREAASSSDKGKDQESKAGGGLVRGYGSGTSDSNVIRASKGEYVVTADGSNLGDAIAHFSRGFAQGGLISGFAHSVAHIPGYAAGGHVTSVARGGEGSHQLDIRTDAGNFTATVSQDTMEGIRRSSLGSKLSQTGPRPTWYS